MDKKSLQTPLTLAALLVLGAPLYAAAPPAEGAGQPGEGLAVRQEAVFGHVARRADADRDGSVTPEELEAWFAAHDGNGDGRLDAEDFEARPGKAHGHRHGMGLALDADGDGIVELADLEALTSRYDADGDGALSAEELPGMDREKRRHGRRGDRGAFFLRHADQDGDGAVSRAEWDEAVARRPLADPERAAARFEALDANDDGVLTRNELAAGRRGRHRGR
jgi:Ca2+-binding EF-hand superfamily protein